MLDVCQRTPKLLSFLKFAFIFAFLVVFHYSIFQVTMHSSVSPSYLLIPSSVYFISVISLFSADLLFLVFNFLLKFCFHIFLSQFQLPFLLLML